MVVVLVRVFVEVVVLVVEVVVGVVFVIRPSRQLLGCTNSCGALLLLC